MDFKNVVSINPLQIDHVKLTVKQRNSVKDGRISFTFGVNCGKVKFR